MAPFVENKGSILLAAALNVKWYLAYIGTSIGSFLPVPFLLRAGDRGMQRLRRFGPAARVLDQVEAFSRQHEAFLKRHGYLAPGPYHLRPLYRHRLLGRGAALQYAGPGQKAFHRRHPGRHHCLRLSHHRGGLRLVFGHPQPDPSVVTSVFAPPPPFCREGGVFHSFLAKRSQKEYNCAK